MGKRLSNEEAKKRTRRNLQTALVSLMGEKPLDKISVTELCNRSNVSRISFYRNYASKEAILQDMNRSLLQAVAQSAKSDMSRNDLRQWYRELFRMLQREAETIRLLFRARVCQNSDLSILPFLHEIFPAASAEHMKSTEHMVSAEHTKSTEHMASAVHAKSTAPKASADPTGSSEEYYAFVAYVGALDTIVREWFARDMRESAEEMAQFCSAFFGNQYLAVWKQILDEQEI